MLRAIKQTIVKRGLLRRGARVLVAVSGGADSVALTYALHYLRRRYALDLILAHLNHRIRGRAADADERFVCELAWRLGLPSVSARVDVPLLAKEQGVSMEMAARQARYDFFAAAARDAGADCVATAHTADDQAETVLLRLARGAGPQGLSGIPYIACRHGMVIIRPMLDVRHQHAVDFLRRHRLNWREDRSNRNMRYLRNLVRHRILPLLESQLNPGARSVIVRTAELLREENEWLDSLAKKTLTACRGPRPGTLGMKILLKQPVAARRRVLRLWLIECGMDPDQLDFDAVQNVESLLGSTSGTVSVSLPGDVRVTRRYGELRVGKKTGVVKPFRVVIAAPGATMIPGLGAQVTTSWAKGVIRQRGVGVGHLPARASISREAVGRSKIIVRSWKSGDRIRPLGMSGSCKLQDVFVDAKVPRDARNLIPVFECRGEIIWIPGYRVARGWEVLPSQQTSLRIEVDKPRALT